MKNTIEFIENQKIAGNIQSYSTITVNTDDVIGSWRESLFSYEWLRADGHIRSLPELPYKEQTKRQRVEDALKQNAPIEMPVLGIGLLENIEIGIGKAEFLTLSALGYKTIPVHVPRAHESDFKSYKS